MMYYMMQPSMWCMGCYIIYYIMVIDNAVYDVTYDVIYMI